jgi:hypothetical protein
LTTSINNDGDKGEIGKFQNDKVMSTKGILPLGEISPKKKTLIDTDVISGTSPY